MSSSPPDPTDSKAILRATAARWDLACEALERDDDDRVGLLLDENDVLLQGLQPPAADDAEATALRRAAAAAHGRLFARLVRSIDEIRGELGRVRQGRRVLAGYRDPTRGIGNRVESRV